MDFYGRNQSQPSSKKWKAGFYIRLSREDVESDKSDKNIKTFNKIESESVTSQRIILNKYIERFEDIEFIEEYADDGYTGTNFDRPNFQRMIDDIRTKRIDCVIVKDLSRFGRNYAEVGNYLEVFFPMLNIRFISIIDNCDSYLRPESVSNIMIPVKNIMNEGYSRDISLKLRTALDAKKRQGLFIGTYASFGYKKDPLNKNKLLVDEEAAEIVKRIYKEFISGKTCTKIAYVLNSEKILCPATYKKANGVDKYVASYAVNGWNERSIKRILTNPLYIGTLVQKLREKINYKVKKFRKIDTDRQIRVENVVEPIIDVETFNKVQELLKRDTRISNNQMELSLLSGFVHCADCKRGMSKKKSKTWNKKDFINYYVCSTYKNCGSSMCSSHHIRIDKVEECVLEYIKKCVEVALNFDDVVKFVNKMKLETVKTDNLEKILKQKKLTLNKKQLYVDGLYPDYKAEIITQQEYERYKKQGLEEIETIERDIHNLETQIDEIKHGTCEDNDFIKHFIKYQNVDKLNRQMIVELIDNIWIHNSSYIEIDIKYKDQYSWALDFIKTNSHYLQAITPTQKVVNYNG